MKNLAVRKGLTPEEKQKRTEFDTRALLEAPIKNLGEETSGEFYAKGSGVYYRSAYFLSGKEPVNDAPEELLLRAYDVRGNYGEILSATRVAELIADMLNEKRSELLKSLGIKRTAA